MARQAVTLRDVAARARVSRSAVSRTFTPGASVSAKTREKVERAARELGYQPNALASGLTTGRTRLVGMILNNFRNPYYLEVFDHFTAALQRLGFRPLLVNLSDETDPGQSLRMLRQYSVDGVIVASSTLPAEFSNLFAEAGIPVVHAFARHRRNPGIDTVGIDNRACGELAAETLIARGYRKPGFIGGPADAGSTIDRLEGFETTLAASGLQPVVIAHAETYAFEAGARATADALAQDIAFDVLFCADDVISLGAISALKAAGREVPGDIGVLGVNDMAMAAWPTINLTTIRQPAAEIAARAVERLAALMDDPDDGPQAIRLPARLIERGTLRRLP